MRLHRFIVLSKCKIKKMAKFDLSGQIRRHLFLLPEMRDKNTNKQRTPISEFFWLNLDRT